MIRPFLYYLHDEEAHSPRLLPFWLPAQSAPVPLFGHADNAVEDSRILLSRYRLPVSQSQTSLPSFSSFPRLPLSFLFAHCQGQLLLMLICVADS